METRKINFNNKTLTLRIRDEADASVVVEIFKLREYRRTEEVISSTTNPIVDVGAHAGFFSLYAHSLNPTVVLFALEPEPNNLKALEQTLTENNISNVTIIPKALYNETGRANLMLSSDSHNHFLELPFKGDGQKLRVATTTLEELMTVQGFNKISLLKMDIEGGEYAVFENLKPETFAAIENIFLEYHETKSKKHTIIEKILREQGFGVEIFPSKFDDSMGFLWARNKKSARLHS